MAKICIQSGRTVAKARKPRYYVDGAWLYKCSCGVTIWADKVGHGKNGGHGLIIPSHDIKES